MSINTSTKISHSYYNYYRDGTCYPRPSYAQRLKTAVDNILRATGASKVILVAHSMGGLVARAYIKWLDGADKVFKLLTVATPNKGIPGDMRYWIVKTFQAKPWQYGGENEEMVKISNFSGRSYTGLLNEGLLDGNDLNWEEFCNYHGIKYATIRGNYNPWTHILPFIHIGDGVVDESDAKLDGAEFNGVFYGAHMGSFPMDTINSRPFTVGL